MAELGRRGLPVRHATSPQDVVGNGFFLCDAGSDDDLGPSFAPGELSMDHSCGSARRAWRGRSPDRPRRRRRSACASPLLLVIGSHHPVTLAQSTARGACARCDDSHPAGHQRFRSGGRGAAAALAARGAALVFALPDGTGAETAGPLFDRAMALAIERMAPPRCLVVTGGATLFRLVRALGAERLLVQGELMPGIAVSRPEGGRWPGATVLSKSGAFGAPDLLVRWWHLVQS